MRLFLCLLPLAITACSSPQHSEPTRDRVSTPQGREYNPTSQNYEWRTPGKAPVSPGADRTSRQPYR